MDAQAFIIGTKALGAGISMIALAGVGLGIGHLFSSMITTIGRNPATYARVFPATMLGFALTEAVALFTLLIAFLILFA